MEEYIEEYTDEELQALNEQDFEQDKARASECPHRKHAPSMICDGCGLMQACTSLSEKNYD